jgi:2-dehydro-3-deoxyphosphogluconate aldolase/(4S)-4-hydroxy-2-oxoglutarate aldolase
MGHDELYAKIRGFGIIPVVAIDSVDAALPLADALSEGGLPVAEITFRTDAAADVIREIVTKRPEMLVGAGTLLTAENLERAVDCGASFGVAPGCNPTVIQKARELDFAFSPGVMTPSDVERALELGVTVLKFFPAGAAGGVEMLKSLAAPYAHTGVRFIPTGGVDQGNLAEYLALPSVVAVGGTWVATRADLAAGDWSGITERCRAALAAVPSDRPGRVDHGVDRTTRHRAL